MCKTEKEDAEFRIHKSRKLGREYYCRDCSNAYQRKWRASEKYKIHARARQRGLSQEKADLILASQKGKCGICKTEYPGKNGWHLDHDHLFKIKRGMLCSNCNRGLGHFKDSVDNLAWAIAYLVKWGKTLC